MTMLTTPDHTDRARFQNLRNLAGTLLLAVGLVVSTHAEAHLLNMTEIQLESRNPETATLTVKIDLGQSLMSAEQYWDAVSADSGTQRSMLEPAAAQLTDGISLSVNGVARHLELHSWQLVALSLEAIENPLTPQMSVLNFTVERGITDKDAVLELQIMPQLEIPLPALMRIDQANVQLPVSRLLTERDRSSGPIALGEDFQSKPHSMTTGLALGFQQLVPGLSWVAIGFQHILPEGLDHIVFVLGLFFLSTTLKILLMQVSCFTVAHSLTLALATLGWISVPASIVEPLIAASIVFIALDNLGSIRLERWRLLIVALFGLLHGLGFAAVLSELTLPAGSFMTSLLLFNVGVELGQIAVLILAALTVGSFRGWANYQERVARPATVTIAGIGAYWLVKRVAFL